MSPKNKKTIMAVIMFGVIGMFGYFLGVIGYRAWQGYRTVRSLVDGPISERANFAADIPDVNPFAEAKTNPFEGVRTNPFAGGYKNPFE